MLTLYGIALSTFTRKVRLALAEKGIEYRFEIAAMGSPRVRALNPLGKIPVLEHDELAIPDSSVILAYLERLSPARPLYPGDAGSLARSLWLEEYADTRLREATVPFFAEHVVKPVFQGKAPDETALLPVLPMRDESFGYLEAQVGDQFAVGEVFTVADLAIGAQLVTYRQAGGDITRWPHLARYFEGLCARPAWAGLLDEERGALAAAEARRRSS